MDLKTKKTFPGGMGTARERILLFVTVALSAILSCGILGISFMHRREEAQRLQLAENAFLAAFSDLSEASSPMETVLVCERALIALEECADSGIHYELWQKLVSDIQKNFLEEQELGGDLTDVYNRLAEGINASFQNGRDGHVTLREADATLCSVAVEKKVADERRSADLVWQRLPIGRRNFLRKLSSRTASYLGTSAGMEEALQAVDLSVHIMYCQNAFVMFRMRGNSFVKIVTCKPRCGAEEIFDLERAVREYHLPINTFVESERYVEEGICARVYESREGYRLHLVKDLVSGKISVVDLTS